jgi:hypothetical protein
LLHHAMHGRAAVDYKDGGSHPNHPRIPTQPKLTKAFRTVKEKAEISG